MSQEEKEYQQKGVDQNANRRDLVLDDYADLEDVDRSYMAATGQKIGPFGIVDRVGINVFHDVCEEGIKRSDEEDLARIADFVRPYVERGDLGWKSGKGFYTYPNPLYKRPEFLSGDD